MVAMKVATMGIMKASKNPARKRQAAKRGGAEWMAAVEGSTAGEAA